MKRLLSFCLVFALGTLLAVAGEKITYRFAPELGKTFTYRITTTSEFSNSTNESKKVETSMTTHIKATSLENDVYTVKMSAERPARAEDSISKFVTFMLL